MQKSISNRFKNKTKRNFFAGVLIISSLFCLFIGGFSCGGNSGTGDNSPGVNPPPAVTPPPVTLPSCKDGYCLIPEGTFQMGSLDADPDAQSNEKPSHQVTESAFMIGKTEVTVGQYKKILQLTDLSGDLKKCPLNTKGDQYPIVCLTFKEKRAYCQADVDDKGHKGDLPTAAQIERASRGVSGMDPYGTPIDKAVITGNKDDSGKLYTDYAVPCGAGDTDKEERANSFGVCDLAGNVWESALDQYEDNFYKSAQFILKDPYNPITDETKQREELRGGSLDNEQVSARAANRVGFDPGSRYSNDGFRCARPLPQ